MITAHHPMRYAGLRLNYHEFLCDLCGRHVLIHANPTGTEAGDQTFVILQQGDPQACHSGGIGAWVVGGLEVAECDEACELTPEWKGWLDEILDDDN